MTDSTIAISVRDLTKRFESTLACNQVSLQVRKGITYGLLGPNGAGKSTLIRILMGLTRPDSGQAELFGHSSQQRTAKLAMRIGYVPELHFIYRWMKVREVIDFVSKLYLNWEDDLAANLLDKFELSPEKRVSTLSKGMTAKLGLLLGLSHNPDLLVLDEPTSGLDPIIREDFLESVLQNPGNDRTIIFSSHHVDDVERVSDEVGVMIGGQLVIEGQVDELRARVKRVRFVLRDGTLPTLVPKEVVHQRLDRREWTVTLYPFSAELRDRIQSQNGVTSADTFDLSLEEIFKDVVRGARARP